MGYNAQPQPHASPLMSTSTPLPNISQQLLARICHLEYPPGTQLKESVLAKEFGVSRTPVREALNRLSHLGLIESRNGVGTVVVALSEQAIHQVYEMRLALAPLIGQLSPMTLTDEHLSHALNLLREAKALCEQFDPEAYIRLNHRLNQLLIQSIGNQALKSSWEQLYYQAASTWHQLAQVTGAEMAKELVAELESLVMAYRHKDAVAIGHIQRLYIHYGYKRLCDGFAQSALN